MRVKLQINPKNQYETGAMKPKVVDLALINNVDLEVNSNSQPNPSNPLPSVAPKFSD
jgi:hypothetical protein